MRDTRKINSLKERLFFKYAGRLRKKLPQAFSPCRAAHGNLQVNRIFATGLLGSVFIAVALGLNYYVNQDAPAPVAEAGPSAPAPLDAPLASLESVPAFDIVRISPEGSLVIAGRAPADSVVTVRAESGGVTREIGMATANSRGEWVILSEDTRFTGETELTLQVKRPDGTVQDAASSVLVAIPESASQPLVILTSRGHGGVSRVLQMPEGPESGPGNPLAVTVVDYTPDGQMSVSGQAPAGDAVDIWLDGAHSRLHLGRTTAGPAGAWRLRASQLVPEGRYTLRVEGSKNGATDMRLQLPFERLGMAALEKFDGDTVFVVQPGNNLWRVARKTLGKGLAYTVIYEANKSRIGNPDLIYPGQIFQFPAR